MKILRWIQGKTRKDHIRNVTIREEAHIKPINTFLMKKRLSWFGHVQRRDDDNVAKSVLNTRIDGSRPRGRPLEAEVYGPIKIRHEEKQHTPRVGILQSELVQHDEKRQPYPGNDGKVRNLGKNWRHWGESVWTQTFP